MKIKHRNRTIALIVVLLLLLLLLVSIVGSIIINRYAATQPTPPSQISQTGKNATNEGVPLINTYWRLITLNAKPAQVYNTEAHFVLELETGRFHGSSGCNRIRGEYKSNDEILTFSDPVAMTRMMCADGAEQEKAFLTALKEARVWRISDDNLMLLNDQGRMIARFKQQLMQ